ncbi:hypothetical protein PAXRUDRAFT_15634 [Paxillus rubicundulus Ve08.2h10]|uniref:Unplaced genomic scaffold scaffold_1128, whole genome shotgun sequence n=1 Tax=Paxillus rubicundulus Ve08.2h10 TaxID=930991 RepID=A0A0D0CD99_9AGAM|nr:hypothetical protein PAXRUDRAFT_15634 [Paxillus rubicundulus Ve08.2h10]
MSTPQVMHCPDGHFCCVIFGIGPYIADYPEQVLLSSIIQSWCGRCVATPKNLNDPDGGAPQTQMLTDALVEELSPGVMWDEWGVDGNVKPFTNNFPRVDIYELLTPNILHQLVKGTFKDHLAEWVGKYLDHHHGKSRAKEILADIDRRIAAAPSFPGLQRFPNGRGFLQWTGNDSKALMKVYLPAIEGYIPDDVMRTFRAFFEFCYTVRKDVITEKTLADLDDALSRFHQYHKHSLVHYQSMIRTFGAPNGLCTSITESKHIKAVKQLWQHSSKYKVLSQILLTNQCLNKLAASRVDFEARGMLSRPHGGTHSNDSDNENNMEATLPAGPSNLEEVHANKDHNNAEGDNFNNDEDENTGIVHERPGLVYSDVKLALTPARKRAHTVLTLAVELGAPVLSNLLQRFLFNQLNTNNTISSVDVHLSDCPRFTGSLKVFHSATAVFVSPSDPSGIGGMRREQIHATPSWHCGPGHYDCIFVSTDDTLEGMLSMEIARVLCFFSFVFTNGQTYPCALIHWFDRLAEEPDNLMGMWMVTPSFLDDGSKNLAVVHIDSIVRGAHLLPIFGTEVVPEHINFHNSLDLYRGFYVNRFVDHHTFELAS